MDYIVSFKQYLIDDGKAEATINSYIFDSREFVQFLADRGIVFDGEMTRFQVTSYRKHLLEAGLKPRTINKKVNSIRCLGQFLIKQKKMTENTVEPKKDRVQIASGSDNHVDVFTDQEIDKILIYVNGSPKFPLRNKTAVYLLLYTGVRVTELVDIKCKNVDLLSMQLRVMGKGTKERTIPLKTEVVEVIKEYLNKERKNHMHAQSEYLLISPRIDHMHRDAVNKMLIQLSNALDIDIYPHKFRHTFCSRLISKGVPITTVSKLAGHAHIQTTADYYVDTSKKDKENALELL